MSSLSEAQRQRYSRHIALSELGPAGQEKLLAARVLVVGLGGLGSPAAMYLAAAGVGTLGIADPDEVDLTNLQRQVLHHTPDLGAPKVESAAAKLHALNPDVKIETHRLRLGADTAADAMSGYDFVIDATDGLASKLLLNDAAHFARRPLSHAGVLRFAGQAMTILPGRTACLRCVFDEMSPERPDERSVRVGILGPMAGVMGTIQAAEAVKFIVGAGELLTNALLSCDLLRMSFRKLSVSPDPDCPLCGRNPTITVPGQLPPGGEPAAPA